MPLVRPNDRTKKFLEYSAELISALEKRDEVIGLIFLGSTANTNRVDEWSDHDFFVITKKEFAEKLRQNLNWLPHYERVAIAPRETDHGLKAIYEDGQVVEFAIFDDQELEVVSVNAYEVVLDKSDISARMAAIASIPKIRPFNADIEFQLFLSQILIGVGRARRGELLSAGQFIRAYAMNYALGLIRFWLAPNAGSEADEDDLNRFRRFEYQYPEIARALDVLQQMDVESSARELLQLIEDLGKGHLSEAQESQIKVVVDRLGWAL